MLNLTLGSTMTTEQCLEIIEKFDKIGQNKFYTINVYDAVTKTYMGDSELAVETDKYRIITSLIRTDTIFYYIYTFNKNGKFSRTAKSQSLSSILSRLEELEQKLNDILIEK